MGKRTPNLKTSGKNVLLAKNEKLDIIEKPCELKNSVNDILDRGMCDRSQAYDSQQKEGGDGEGLMFPFDIQFHLFNLIFLSYVEKLDEEFNGRPLFCKVLKDAAPTHTHTHISQ